MERLVPLVPHIQPLLAGFHFHHLGQGMRVGQHRRLPGIVTALDGQGNDHRFQVGAGVVDVVHLIQRHGRYPVAFLADRVDQVLGHQLRQCFAQRAHTQVVAFLEGAHQ